MNATEEKRLMYHLSQGKSAKECANAMGLTTKSVQRDLRKLRRIRNCKNTIHLVCTYLFQNNQTHASHRICEASLSRDVER